MNEPCQIKLIVTVYLPGEALRIGCYTSDDAVATANDFSLEYPGRVVRITLYNEYKGIATVINSF